MSAMDMFWAAPPVMRTLVAATVLSSCAVYGGFMSYYYILFYPALLYKKFPPQIWRLVTSFWLTGPQLSILFDPYFLWTYGSALETESPRFSRKGDFFFYVAFIHLAVLVLDAGLFGGVTFLHSLTLAFAYTYSQDNSNRQVSFFIVNFSARYLPFAMLAMTFVMAGPDACKHQGCGLVAAHLFDFLTRIWPTYGGGRNWLKTPEFVCQWFGAGQQAPQVSGHGTAFPGRSQGRSTGVSTGSSSSVPNWSSRGTGRRLGD